MSREKFLSRSNALSDSVRSLLLALAFVSQTVPIAPADALGLVGPATLPMVRVHPRLTHKQAPAAPVRTAPAAQRATTRSATTRSSVVASKKAPVKKTAAAPATGHAIPPQNFIGQLKSQSIAPGVTYKSYRGALSINVIDVDMMRAPVKVQPSLAGESFDRLKDVADHARESRALAAINANYFKKNGTPLGTLIVDGEWVSGPLYDRVSMGITKSGYVRIDRVNLGGTLTTNNPEVPSTWVNNINQPRRSGCHLFAYTRRWGSFVKLPYEGSLVAVDAQGKVTDTGTTSMGIPWGGFVLTDSKNSDISKLERGDSVQIQWKTAPPDWQDVTEAVSGGPMLIKDGKIYLDLKDEMFRKAWTGAQIHARTAAGVTNDNHLLMVTVEGPHTLWDLAKFLHQMGATEAMNLDGGGSTTMVVNGNTVTRNAKASQRRVASSIVVLDLRNAPTAQRTINPSFLNGVTSMAPLPPREAAVAEVADDANAKSETLNSADGMNGPLLEARQIDSNKDADLFALRQAPDKKAKKKSHKSWWNVLP